MEADSSKDEKRENAEIQRSLGVAQSIAPDHIGDENQSNEIASLKKRLEGYEKWEFRFTLAIAFAAIISAGVAYLQWHTMDRQLDEMRGNGQQADMLIAQAAEQARATSRFAETAKDSLEESRRQFLRDQRPYVMPRAIPFMVAPNQEIIVNLHSGNYGKTPAIKVGVAGGIFLGKDALARAYQWFSKDASVVFNRSSGVNIPPGIPASHLEATINTIRTNRIISEKEYNSLVQRDFSIVVTLRQAYLDTAGNEYWTDFCVGRLASGEGAIAYCPQHNEIH